MTKKMFKCCFCLETTHQPIVMCEQTHVGCFECVCEQLRKTVERPPCAMCRSPLSLRFDRLITEIAPCKKRKRTTCRYEVFMQLLELKQKSKYKVFNRSLKKFAMATEAEATAEQMSKDIANIKLARDSARRLKEQGVFNAQLYAHLTI
jgi:hypothetical protein